MNKKTDIKLTFKPQAFFIDLDGTALDSHKAKLHISEENLNAIKLVNKKIPVIISTGRINSKIVVELMQEFGSPYAICQNGGLIIDKENKIIAKYPIPNDELEGVIDFLKEEKMFMMFNSAAPIYGKASRIKWIKMWSRHASVLPYEDIPVLEDGCTKILAFGKSKKNMLKLKEILMQKHINVAIDIIAKGYAYEITSSKASKGLADSFVSKLLNVDPKLTVHLGDSGNDVTTIPFVGEFIAMANSIKLIKKQAKVIGPHYKKAGLGKLLLKLSDIDNND